MSTRSQSTFQVTGWDQVPTGETLPGPYTGRAEVTKTFTGDLEGTSTAEVLLCQADPKDLTAGAGFIGQERVTGTLGGRAGSFVMQHWGVAHGSTAPVAGGHIVPGSGTDALAGITGTVRIAVDDKGQHTLTLDFDLP